MVAAGCRPSTSARASDETLLQAGEKKNVSHMWRPPTLISSFGRDDVMRELSRFIKFRAHPAEGPAGVRASARCYRGAAEITGEKTRLWTHDPMFNLHDRGQTISTHVSLQKNNKN